MKTLHVNTAKENKGKLIFISFTNTKRAQWSKYRRYAS
jgi:hypothetical protein